MNPLTTPPSGKSGVPHFLGVNSNCTRTGEFNPEQPNISTKGKIDPLKKPNPKLYAQPVRTILKPKNLTVKELKINGSSNEVAKKTKAERIPTNALLPFLDALDDQLSDEIGVADPQVAAEPSGLPKTPVHTATGATYPEADERLREILEELSKLNQGCGSLVQQNAPDAGPVPAEQPVDLGKKAEIDLLNAELDALGDAIDNPEIAKKVVTDVVPLPKSTKALSPVRPATDLAPSSTILPNLALKTRQGREAREAKARKLVTNKKNPWTVKPSQQNGPAPKNQKVALKKHANQAAQPAKKPAVQASVVAIPPKRLVEMESGHLALFGKPLSPETGRELKKSLAKTTLFGFKPKWFQEKEKDLIGYINRFQRLVLQPSSAYTNQNYINAAQGIIDELDRICRTIETERPRDNSIALLKRDIAELERVLSQYL